MRITVEVSEENIVLLKKEYKEHTGKEPSDDWIHKFLQADANNQYNKFFGEFIAYNPEEFEKACK